MLTFLIVLLICGILLYQLRFRASVDLKLPPGPKPLPIIGNVTDLPPKGTPEYQHWLKFKDTYGLISSVNVFGQIMVVLHDREAVHEIMEKNSMKTSGRPWFEFAYNLSGFGRFVLLKQYDDVLRKYRKFMHQQFGTKTLVAQFHGIQKAEVARLLVRVLETPENLIQHFST
jgi:cytochrome P450